MTVLYIILGVLALSVLWLASSYNKLVRLRVRAQEAWSDIEVQLKRRHNLIPNLVETVKGYAQHEKGVFEEVAKWRSAAMNSKTMSEKAKAENMLTETLKTLFAVSENYPELKASQNFLELQRELRNTEDKIQAARRFYNSLVRDLNIKIETFPSNIVAKIFRFNKMDLFKVAEESEKEVPKVEF